jgi:signal transduction histidine kinase
MLNPWTTSRIPALIRDRRWWLLALLAWALVVFVSFQRQLDDLHRQSLEVASEGARNLFNMVVLTRAWNAGHGGVYVPVSEKAPPNPYLVHPRRDLVSSDGQRLTMINPAYMTRQISELAQTKGGTVFHITSLKPIRPQNAPDAWEQEALLSFEQGKKEVITLLKDPAGLARLRFMAPLKVAPPCMVCHAVQGYKVGDVRGGISVTVPFDPMRAIVEPARKQTLYTHLGVFMFIALSGWALLELLRRRWHDVAENLTALETARNAMQAANDELARARDAAEAASRSKSAFLGAMSHELRTPLNGILGFAHLLRNAGLPDKSQNQARRIAEQGEHLLTLVNEVIEFAYLESLSPPEQAGTVELTAMLADFANELRRAASVKGLQAEIDIAPNLPARVSGEPAWLLGCLRPLLSNAVKFTDQGTVRLTVRMVALKEGASLFKVTLSDTGIGIDKVDHDKLFQPFRQVDGATTRRHGGLGLGLAISARYAGLLGGRLSFDSEPGAGSHFHFDWITRAIAPNLVAAVYPVADDLDAVLAELAHLLSEDDMRSAAALLSALPLLEKMFDMEAVAQLRRQVAAFDYPAALASLRAIQGRA